MRWGDFRRSDNVEDRTGEDSGGGFSAADSRAAAASASAAARWS